VAGRLIAVSGRHPLHRVPPSCGEAVVRPRRIVVNRGRGDLCRECFPGARQGVIRLGRRQRELVRRALSSPSSTVYPAGKQEFEAVRSMLARGLFLPAPALPGAYRIASATLEIHLCGAVLQHGKD
jgi:hypothetical protein